MATHNLPPDMILAYKRYKEDTETVAGWLAEKSKKAGYKPNTDITSIGKEPKLKGRARKLARDAAKESPIPMKEAYGYTVKVAEFVEMAKQIVKVRPKVILSRTIKAIWERAIKMRRQCGEWFKAKAESDVLANDQHSYFVSVLEEALATLQPCHEIVTKSVPAKSKSKASDDDVSDSLREVNHMFAHLQIEDTLSGDEEAQETTTAGGSLPVEPSAPRAHIEFDEKEAEGEFFFAIWSFMQDVLVVRIHVATIWHLYSVGKVELIQAASVTNLAVDLVRRAEADFEAELKRPIKFPASKYPTGNLPFLIFTQHLPAENRGPLDPAVRNVIVICGCEICDFLLYVPWAMARIYVEALKQSPVTYPTSNNGFRVQVPPHPCLHSRLSKSHMYHAKNPSQRAQTEMNEILPDSLMISLMLRRGFIEDEIVHAARFLLENHKVCIWVSLAFQIQLDIQHLNKLHPIKAFDDLKSSFQVTKARVKEHGTWSKSLDFEVWPKSKDIHVQWLNSEFAKWIEGSQMGGCGKADGEEVMRRVAAGESYDEAFRTAKRIPLLELFPNTCGTMKTELQLEFHLLGVDLINETGHVKMLCHLYNALRIISPDAPMWPDMELLIRIQGVAKIFIGGRPTTLEDAQKRFHLSMGLSARTFAKDSKGRQYTKSKSQKREFERAPIQQLLLERWKGAETRKVDEAAYALQELLFNKEYQRRLKEDMHMSTASDFDPFLSKLVPAQTKIVQTLSRLSLALTTEMPALAFDYFSFERKCFEMFLRLNQDVRAKLRIPDSDISKKERVINSPVSTTITLLDGSVNTEATIRAMKSNDRAKLKSVGQDTVKKLNALSAQATDGRSEIFLGKAIKAVREGRPGEFLKEIMDMTENAAALKIFEPVRLVIDKVLNDGKGDQQIRALRKVTGQTTYGVFLFSHPSLEAMYGSNGLQQLKDIGIAEEQIKQATLSTADNPVFYILALVYLHQPKVMCGEGEDSFAASGFESMIDDSSSESESELSSGPAHVNGIPVPPEIRGLVGAIINHLDFDRENNNELQAVDDSHRIEELDDDYDDGEEENKDDWDKYEGIYGRRGNYARD